jgi:murein L,D-transpeptidase YcbB/YkuD
LYEQLKKELQRFTLLEKNGGWVAIPVAKKSWRLGDSSETVGLIRKRLLATGELSLDSGSALYDEALEAAVKNFQKNHGLNEDGVAGPGVIREMNVPVRERIEQIIVNMERCRWLPNQTEEEYVVVNIPQFKVFAFEKDSMVFSSNVVVGKETNKTVIFKGDMKYVVFSPYWNVPESIMKKEIIPAIRRNPQYLERNNMEWNDGKIRQKPGKDNALGKVKFLFPNVYNIYLHDTPSKHLFKEEKRAFSHGCIRVADPKNLAVYLLRHQKEWTEAAITVAMESGKELFVPLRKPIPVYIVYFTAFVDQQGKINFRKDVYQRDQALKEMLIK